MTAKHPWIPCITVRCDRVAVETLKFLAAHTSPPTVYRFAGAALLAALLAAFILFEYMRAGHQTRRAAFLLSGAALLAVLSRALPDAIDSMRSPVSIAPWLNLHTCWNHSRCSKGFSVFIQPSDNSHVNVSQLRQSKHPSIWVPPEDVQIADSPADACVVLIPLVRHRSDYHFPPELSIGHCERSEARLETCPPANGGHNYVIVDNEDDGVGMKMRLQHLGCALLAQSHTELTNFVPFFDISIPLPMIPGRLGGPSLNRIERLALLPASKRAYWLTFKGAVSYAFFEHRVYLMSLSKRSTAERKIVVTGKCRESSHGQPLFLPTGSNITCEGLKYRYDRSPPYIDLLNTTFALVPGGLSPASFRLNEVVAAGAIPVFVSGDVVDSSPYVPPFSDVVPWHQISLHFAWEDADRIVDALLALDAATIQQMQRQLRKFYLRYLRWPDKPRQTLFSLLQKRSSFRFR